MEKPSQPEQAPWKREAFGVEEASWRGKPCWMEQISRIEKTSLRTKGRKDERNEKWKGKERERRDRDLGGQQKQKKLPHRNSRKKELLPPPEAPYKSRESNSRGPSQG
jgi:hypothetical protein